MNDNYYSLLSREELVEKDGAHLPLRTESLASAAQFDEMSPEQQQRIVQLQLNQPDVDFQDSDRLSFSLRIRCTLRPS